MNDPQHAALAAFKSTTQQCRYPGCRTLTTERLCSRHRIPAPEGQWAVAASLKAEVEREVEGER